MTKTLDIKQTPMHTPEPWEDNGNGLIYGQCSGDDDEAPFVADACNDPNAYTEPEQVNARRICASVNACKGISTEALEQGVVAELLSTLTDFFNIMHDYESSVAKGYVQQAMEWSRAAITKATGRAA